MKQADSLVHDDELRRTIIANAKEYVDTNHSEESEHKAYSIMARDMCRPLVVKKKEGAENLDDDDDSDMSDERKTRVRFQLKKGKKSAGIADVRAEFAEDMEPETAPDPESKETAGESQLPDDNLSRSAASTEGNQNQTAENELSSNELEDGVTNTEQSTSEPDSSESVATCRVEAPDSEGSKPQLSQISSEPVSVTKEVDEDEPKKTVFVSDAPQSKDDVQHAPAKLRINVVTDTAAASTPPTRSPRFAVTKTDAQKRTTPISSRPASAKESPPSAAGKGGGAAGKNGSKPSTTSVFNGSKKTTTSGTPRKTPLNASCSADKATSQKSAAAAHTSAARSKSDTVVSKSRMSDVGSRPTSTSRPNKTKK